MNRRSTRRRFGPGPHRAEDGRSLYQHLIEAAETIIRNLLDDEGLPPIDVGFGMLSAAVGLFRVAPPQQRREIAEILRGAAASLGSDRGRADRGTLGENPADAR
jgi:hypothetical protein